jgi:inosine/xanthosine triphosphate pyrophosphatase family protein
MYTFVSNNKSKIVQFKRILPEIRILELDLLDVKAPIEIAIKHKCKEAYKIVRGPVIVEITKLFIFTYNNRQLEYSKEMADLLGLDDYYNLISFNFTNKVEMSCAIAYTDDGVTAHTILTSKLGKFVRPSIINYDNSWNCIFQPIHYDKTYGEMTINQLLKISERGHCLRTLKTRLDLQEVIGR